MEDIQEKHRLLMEAFDETFRKDLEDVCKNIEEVIKEYIEGIGKFDSRINNVFSIQSRVKGRASFEEKLYRKNYVKEWSVSDNKEENQTTIKRKLPDLIGIRVNCYFAEYEKRIYNIFRNDPSALPDFVFDFKENTTQKNGLIIYKFSGIYKDSYNFEIQIKSVVHNIWGEVEHKTVYKNPDFDGFMEKKEELTLSLHEILRASENQLLAIFGMQEDKDELLKSLFFCMTKNEVAEKCKTRVLAKHYANYFRAFPDLRKVKHYVALKLEDKVYELEYKPKQKDDRYAELRSRIDEEFPEFYLQCLFNIDSMLFQHETYEDFVYYFIQSVISFEDDDDELLSSYTEYGDESSVQDPLDPMEDYLVKIDQILGKCRIKEE